MFLKIQNRFLVRPRNIHFSQKIEFYLVTQSFNPRVDPPFVYLQDPDLYSPLQVPLVPLQFENPAMVLLADGNYVI